MAPLFKLHYVFFDIGSLRVAGQLVMVAQGLHHRCFLLQGDEAGVRMPA